MSPMPREVEERRFLARWMALGLLLIVVAAVRSVGLAVCSGRWLAEPSARRLAIRALVRCTTAIPSVPASEGPRP
jgi:hypothetical protein